MTYNYKYKIQGYADLKTEMVYIHVNPDLHDSEYVCFNDLIDPNMFPAYMQGELVNVYFSSLEDIKQRLYSFSNNIDSLELFFDNIKYSIDKVICLNIV